MDEDLWWDLSSLQDDREERNWWEREISGGRGWDFTGTDAICEVRGVIIK